MEKGTHPDSVVSLFDNIASYKVGEHWKSLISWKDKFLKNTDNT